MAQLNLKSTVRPKKYSSYKGGAGITAPNVLERDFNATKPDEKWATDVTEFKVREQRVYLSPIIDLFTKEIIAYKIAKDARLPLVTDMLKDAINSLDKHSKPIVHSDQGWQYRHIGYQKQLTAHGLTQSMSRKGNCWDNAVAESFFKTIKSEELYRHEFENMGQVYSAVFDYIDGWYNTKRIHSTLDGKSPREMSILLAAKMVA